MIHRLILSIIYHLTVLIIQPLFVYYPHQNKHTHSHCHVCRYQPEVARAGSWNELLVNNDLLEAHCLIEGSIRHRLLLCYLLAVEEGLCIERADFTVSSAASPQ